ncbi:NADH dehydrogenase [[Actinomadura] parvosata subsp. kistnae]|uniref:FAD-dependent oxidoreductase n=1 Tax=[Actinomadura] parvosata TaxID=1955412 RepID=UPI000D2EDAA8|nr:NADH dehydrogenase [Actinomadura parvosata subsp. kistnae]
MILLEQAEVVTPDLGPMPRPEIEKSLAELNIDLRLGTTLTSADAHSVTLADGSRIPADAVICTAGLHASPLTQQIPADRDPLGRLKADRHPRVLDDVFTAGYVATALAYPRTTSCKAASTPLPLGKVAGHNTATDLPGLPPVEFAPTPTSPAWTPAPPAPSTPPAGSATSS